MAVKIACLLLGMVATCSSLQKPVPDDILIGQVEATAPSQNVVPELHMKLMPLIRPQRSLNFNPIHTHIGSGFRRNFRRSGASGQFGQVGSRPQNGFVNTGSSGGFNNGGRRGYQAASVPNRFVGSANQGFRHTGGGFRNPVDQGGFRSPINPSGFTPGGGFRTPVNPVGVVPGRVQPSGFVNTVNPGSHMSGDIQPGGFRSPIKPSGFVPGSVSQG